VSREKNEHGFMGEAGGGRGGSGRNGRWREVQLTLQAKFMQITYQVLQNSLNSTDFAIRFFAICILYWYSPQCLGVKISIAVRSSLLLLLDKADKRQWSTHPDNKIFAQILFSSLNLNEATLINSFRKELRAWFLQY
jgi:hypothetical protein